MRKIIVEGCAFHATGGHGLSLLRRDLPSQMSVAFNRFVDCGIFINNREETSVHLHCNVFEGALAAVEAVNGVHVELSGIRKKVICKPSKGAVISTLSLE